MDRRKSCRIYAADVYFVEFYTKTSPELQIGNGRDISAYDFRFASDADVKVGDVLDVTICLPLKFNPSKKVPVKVKVIRRYQPRGARRKRLCCEFIFENEETKKIIEAFVEWLKNNPTIARPSSRYYPA